MKDQNCQTGVVYSAKVCIMAGEESNPFCDKNSPQKFMSTAFYREYCKKCSGLKKKINTPKRLKKKLNSTRTVIK